MKLKWALSTALIIGMIPAGANAACFMTYAEFHEAVPHIDLLECPPGVDAPKEGFCRLALDGTQVTIYTFRLGRENACMVDAKNFSFDDYMEMTAEEKQAAQ